MNKTFFEEKGVSAAEIRWENPLAYLIHNHRRWVMFLTYERNSIKNDVSFYDLQNYLAYKKAIFLLKLIQYNFRIRLVNAIVWRIIFHCKNNSYPKTTRKKCPLSRENSVCGLPFLWFWLRWILVSVDISHMIRLYVNNVSYTVLFYLRCTRSCC